MENVIEFLKTLPFIVILFFNNVIYSPDRVLQGSNLPIDKNSGSWESAASLPSKRFEFASASLDGKIYVIGGIYLPSVWFPTSLAEVYDTRTDSWKKIQNYPRVVHHTSAVTCAGKVYVVGGNGVRISNVSDVYSYNPENDTWEARAKLPVARGALTAVCLNEKVYAIGGAISAKHIPLMHEYDPKTNLWKTKKSMPTAREHLVAVSAKGKIYVLGGYTDTRFNNVVENEVYDPKTDSWQSLAVLPYPVSGFTASVVGDSIFIFGGEQGWAVSNEVHEYKISENRWLRRADMPVARYGLTSVSVSNKIHVIGGSEEIMGYKFNQSHDVFVP